MYENMITDIIEKIDKKEAVVCVVGLGYVGLPTAVFFAESGFRVIGADISMKKIELLSRGISPLSDLNLDDAVKDTVSRGLLSSTTDIADAVKNSDVILVIVPTPVDEAKKPDLSFIVNASRSVAAGLDKGKLVILESTTFPGTTEEVMIPVLEESGLKAGNDFGVGYCPERYNPGDSEHTIDKVARVVAGITPQWGEAVKLLYSKIIKSTVMSVSDLKTAEAAKVIENTQRDLNIALMNELAIIFEKMGIDAMEVINAASTKWNFNVYYPGAGVGGHCLPADPYYLVEKAREVGYHSRVITAGRAVNDEMPYHIFELLNDALNEKQKAIKGSKIVVLGLSYKENVADPRDSPSEKFVKKLKERKADVIICDPYFDDETVMHETHCHNTPEIYEAVKDADAVVLMTAHREFRNIDFSRLLELMKTPVFIDGRRVYDPPLLSSLGFENRAVGYGRKL